MALNIAKEVAAMERMTVKELRNRYEEVFREACRSNNKRWLVKRIAWRLQANEEGDLSERARQRAMELANDADLRMKAPPARKSAHASAAPAVVGTIETTHDNRIPIPPAFAVLGSGDRVEALLDVGDDRDQPGEGGAIPVTLPSDVNVHPAACVYPVAFGFERSHHLGDLGQAFGAPQDRAYDLALVAPVAVVDRSVGLGLPARRRLPGVA